MRDYRETFVGLRGAAKGLREINMPRTAKQMEDAADAIEELIAAFCLLCGICTSPPSAETFYSCEIVRGCLPEPPKEETE